MSIQCSELTSDAEFETIFPLIQQLNPALEKAEFNTRLVHMRKAGYRCVGAYDGDVLVGISGFWVGWRFWCGKYIDIDNFVVDEAIRGKGVGKLLLAWVEAKGREEGCDQAVLDAYMTNFTANRFYVTNHFLQLGYHMIKPLNEKGRLPDSAYIKRL